MGVAKVVCGGDRDGRVNIRWLTGWRSSGCMDSYSKAPSCTRIKCPDKL